MNDQLYAMGRCIITEDPDYILGSVGSWENPSPPFFDRSNTASVEEGDQIIVEKAGKNIVEKFSVVTVALDERGKVPAVGKVAPPFAGQGQFDSRPAHLF